MTRWRLTVAKAIAAVLLLLMASAGARAQTDEIQVYDAEIDHIQNYTEFR